jgi:hypothetical protein
VKRALINGLIKLASLFAKDKVVERIRFAELDDVYAEVPAASLPAYVRRQRPLPPRTPGDPGESGTDGADDDDDGGDDPKALGAATAIWVRARLAAFPPLPDRT